MLCCVPLTEQFRPARRGEKECDGGVRRVRGENSCAVTSLVLSAVWQASSSSAVKPTNGRAPALGVTSLAPFACTKTS